MYRNDFLGSGTISTYGRVRDGKGSHKDQKRDPGRGPGIGRDLGRTGEWYWVGGKRWGKR